MDTSKDSMEKMKSSNRKQVQKGVTILPLDFSNVVFSLFSSGMLTKLPAAHQATDRYVCYFSFSRSPRTLMGGSID